LKPCLTLKPNALIGDPMRLEQVLSNLVSNALKFTEQGHIRISVILEKEYKEKIVLKFSIEDTGIGIKADQVDKLFQSFVQLDGSLDRKHGGLGLGLALCKKLIELMEGEIWMESEPGKGSTFTFTAKFGLQSNVRDKTIQLKHIVHEKAETEEPPEISIAEDVHDRVIDTQKVAILMAQLVDLVEIDISETMVKLQVLKVVVGHTKEIEIIQKALEEFDSDAALEGISKLAKDLNIPLKIE